MVFFNPALTPRKVVSFGNQAATPTKDQLLQKLHIMLTPADQKFSTLRGVFREQNGVDEYLGTDPQLCMDLINANAEDNRPFYESGTRVRLIEGIIKEAEADNITVAQLANLVSALTLGQEEVGVYRLVGLLDRYLEANGHQPQCYF